MEVEATGDPNAPVVAHPPLLAEPDASVEEFDLEDFTQRVDLRVRFALGIQVPRERFTGYFESRYSVGLAEVYEAPLSENSKVRSHVLAFVIGVQL